MIPSHLVTLTRKSMLMLLAGLPLAVHADNTLIVVEDLGGTSALPYYEALHLQPRGDAPARSPIPPPSFPSHQRTKLRCCRCAASSSPPALSRGG